MNLSSFSGTGALARFILRRDRMRLAAWILGLSAFVVLFVPVFSELLDTGDGNIIFVTMMENPAMVAIVGPVYGAENYTVGAMYSNMMLLFSAMIAALMNIFLVTRHTRQDEELGRLEVVRSLPVGRLANLASVLVTAFGANLLLSLISGFGMYALREPGMDFLGCMLFGVSLGVSGMLFAGITAVFCQITANNRTATSLSLMTMLVFYMLRAVGDTGTEFLSLLSPLGLVLRTEVFVQDFWWPILILTAEALVFVVLAFNLARIRDLGRGLIAEKPGRAHASTLLSSPLGLALKLLRTSIIVWLIVVFVLAAMYGSVFGDLDSFIGNNEMLKAIFMADPNFSLSEQFITMLLAIMSMIATLPVLSFAHRIVSEEKHGYAEHIFGRAVSRPAQMMAYLSIAFVLSVLMQFLAALGFWMAGSMVLDTIPSLEVFIQAAFSYLPAMWVMLGISVVLIAFFPKFTSFAYAYLGYAFLSVYIGTIADLPEWTRAITPYGHISRYPVEEINWTALAVLALISAVCIVFGFIGYRKRDTQTQ